MGPMANSPNDPAQSHGPTNASAATNFGLVALNLGVMSVVLGLGAMVVGSVAIMLSVVVLVEAAGAFYFARRARTAGDAPDANPSSRPRIARGLAILGLVLAAIAMGPILL